MDRRTKLVSLIALAVVLSGAVPASAEESETTTSGFDWSALRRGLGFDSQDLAHPTALMGFRQVPLVGCRAISRGFGGLRLWAQGAGFAVSRRSAGYGFQGGAAWPIGDWIDLTASYRLTGFSANSSLDLELSDVDGRMAAPILGLAFQF